MHQVNSSLGVCMEGEVSRGSDPNPIFKYVYVRAIGMFLNKLRTTYMYASLFF